MYSLSVYTYIIYMSYLFIIFDISEDFKFNI